MIPVLFFQRSISDSAGTFYVLDIWCVHYMVDEDADAADNIKQ